MLENAGLDLDFSHYGFTDHLRFMDSGGGCSQVPH